MDTIFIAVFSVSITGFFCAVMLCTASKIMHVKVDERLAQLLEYLPGVNCAVCGFPGCPSYAEALLSGRGVKSNLCTPGGAETAAKISAIFGVEAESFTSKTAVVHCLAGKASCAFGCLGCGACKTACPAGAVRLKDSLARIDTSLCTGCGLCVKACPNGLILIHDAAIAAAVLCRNTEKGAAARKQCPKSCIGCGKCARECPGEAIVVENNLAKIDYEKCSGCGRCIEVCVSKCIAPLPILA